MYLVNGFVEPGDGLLVVGAARPLARDVHLDPRPRDRHVGRHQAHVGQPSRHHDRRHLSLPVSPMRYKT